MAHHHSHNHNECCSCEHHHHHHEEFHHEELHHEEHHHHDHDLKHQLIMIVVTALLLIAAVMIEKHCMLKTWQLLLVYLVPYLLIGHETLKEAVEGLVHGQAFNEHFLMSVATIGALCIGFLPGAETQFPEAVFVMLFFQIGELFEGYAEGKSRESIAHLMDIRPDVATIEVSGEKGEVKEMTVSPEEVAVGSIIVVRPGERVPLDGIVMEGRTSLNTIALTGESMPREIAEGDEVVSGCVNQSGAIKVKTTKSFGDSTATKILELVENATEHKSKSEAFITRFARVYTPIVVFAAIALAIIPPIIISLTAHVGGDLQSPTLLTTLPTWLYRALMFLVVSCPCALVISVPLTFFGGIGGASRRGILVKGANYMDVLAKINTVVFDKTGTLTHGQFAVTAVHPGESRCEVRDARCENSLLHLAAHVEHFSTHPIGAALRDAFPDEATDGCQVSEVEEVAGQGIRARVGNQVVCVGNTKMMEAVGAEWKPCHHTGTIIHVAIDGTYAGHIVINDKVKEDSAEAIAQLRQLGIDRMVMLTGDQKDVAEEVARQLNIAEYHAELLPNDKLAYMESISSCEVRSTRNENSNGNLAPMHSRTSAPRITAFVGDGINDAPVLARADVGIAMGGLGSDAAIEAADVVLMDDHPTKIALAIGIARRILRIARQNVWFAIGVKVAVLILATFGLATLWMAVFADVGVTVLAVLNAMRALRT